MARLKLVIVAGNYYRFGGAPRKRTRYTNPYSNRNLPKGYCLFCCKPLSVHRATVCEDETCLDGWFELVPCRDGRVYEPGLKQERRPDELCESHGYYQTSMSLFENMVMGMY